MAAPLTTIIYNNTFCHTLPPTEHLTSRQKWYQVVKTEMQFSMLSKMYAALHISTHA